MNDQFKADEEYEFIEPGSEISSNKVFNNASEAAAKPAFKQFSKRNIIIALVALFVLFFGYKLISAFVHKKPHELASKSQVQPVVESKPTEPKVDQQAQVDSGQNARIEEIRAGNREVHEGVAQLQNRLDQVDTVLQQMFVQMQQQQKLLMKLQPKKKPKTSKHAKPAKVINYYVKAIIPGRAWLLSEAGKFITVTYGTEIPKHGRVKLINANKGIVITDSGEHIGYKADDQ